MDGAQWWNYLLPKRKENRGDLVGGVALFSFIAILFKLVFGGSKLAFGGSVIMVTALDLTAITGLLVPIIGHIVKSGFKK